MLFLNGVSDKFAPSQKTDISMTCHFADRIRPQYAFTMNELIEKR